MTNFIISAVFSFFCMFTFAQVKDRYNYDEVNKKFIQLNLFLYNQKYKTNITYEQAFSDLKNHAESIKNLLKDSNHFDLNELKLAIEKHLSDTLGDIPYNENFNNPFEIIYQKTMQCDSGTRFFLLMLRLIASNKDSFNSFNPVVISVFGHLLFGYIQPDKNGIKNLFGIETTVRGKGSINFGPLNQIHKLPAAILPIEADFYMAEAIETDKKRKKILFRGAYLRMSINYGVEVGAIRKKINRELRNKKSELNKEKLDLPQISSFVFGGPDLNPDINKNIQRKVKDTFTPQEFFKAPQGSSVKSSQNNQTKSILPPNEKVGNNQKTNNSGKLNGDVEFAPI